MIDIGTARSRPSGDRRIRQRVLIGLLAVVVAVLVGLPTGPAKAASSPYARRLAVAGLADPDIYKVSDTLYFLSGTSSQNFLPIYRSTDLATFTLVRTYNPSLYDSRYDYCQEWAPAWAKRNGYYYLYFTASRVAKGAPCPSGNTQPTIFYAMSPATSTAMQFGIAHAINGATTLPRTYVPAGCPADGCQDAMRLDPSVYYDGTRWWMHYAWFGPAGPTISAYPLSAPGQVFLVTQPATPDEQGVNEAPKLFSRNGHQYLFYSQGNYQGLYALRYFMGAQVTDLTRGHTVYSFSSPLRAHDGRIIENEGHNTVIDRYGTFFTLYHVAKFTSTGAYAGRDVYIQPMEFKGDGTLNTLNTVAIHWTVTAGSTYSVDVQTRAGAWITGCLTSGSASLTFNEVCTAAADQVVHKADVAAFRVNRLVSGTTVATTTLTYDGYSDTLTASI